VEVQKSNELQLNDKARALYDFIKEQWGIKVYAVINEGEHICLLTLDGQKITIAMDWLITEDMGASKMLSMDE